MTLEPGTQVESEAGAMEPKITDLILRVAGELRDQGELSFDGELGPETPLFGREGVLDSMALVRLIVEVEQAIEDEFGTPVSLADEKALSQRSSPYRSVASLATYAQTLV